MDRSSIPLVNQRWNFVHGWLGDRKIIRVSLAFRASIHGFNAADFHKRCDKLIPKENIVFILSEFDKVFGGYTNVAWQSSGLSPD